jgi:hypothetical protein
MKKRLFRFDYQPGTTMNEHITLFNQLVAYLLNLDVKFEDEDFTLMVLSSLPDEFEHLETTLLHGKENVSLDAVCSTLYSHELKKQDKKKNRTTTMEEALAARGRQQSLSKGEKEDLNQEAELPKTNMLFVKRKGIGRRTIQN